MTVIYADGACEPRNPGGFAVYGWHATLDHTEITTCTGFVCRGAGATNNTAEYYALLSALTWCQKEGYQNPTIRTDSMLIVNQVNGLWRAEPHRHRPLHRHAQSLARAVQARIEWVPRAENERADELSREAYRLARAGTLLAGKEQIVITESEVCSG